MKRNFGNSSFAQVLKQGDVALVNNEYLPASGAFEDVSEFERFLFLVSLHTIADDVDFTVYQDTGATATGSIKAVTGAAKTDIANATDDNKLFTIEVESACLDPGFRYVTLKATGVSGNSYATVVFLGLNPRREPVTQPDAYLEAVLVSG